MLLELLEGIVVSLFARVVRFVCACSRARSG